jgi:hypothetical protein
VDELADANGIRINQHSQQLLVPQEGAGENRREDELVTSAVNRRRQNIAETAPQNEARHTAVELLVRW